MSNHFSKPIKHKARKVTENPRRVPITFECSYLDGASRMWYIIHIAF